MGHAHFFIPLVDLIQCFNQEVSRVVVSWADSHVPGVLLNIGRETGGLENGGCFLIRYAEVSPPIIVLRDKTLLTALLVVQIRPVHLVTGLE